MLYLIEVMYTNVVLRQITSIFEYWYSLEISIPLATVKDDQVLLWFFFLINLLPFKALIQLSQQIWFYFNEIFSSLAGSLS